MVNFSLFAQIKKPQSPTFSTPSPVENKQTHPMGLHADDVKRQNQQQMQQMMGVPHVPTQEEIKNGTHQQQTSTIKQKNQQELQQILNEAKTSYESTTKKIVVDSTQMALLKKFQLVNPNLPNYQKNVRYYYACFGLITEMLEDKTPLDLKRAVFFSEKARDTTLNWKKFEADIHYWKSIVVELLKQEKLDSTNSLAVNFCIQKLFSDTIHVFDKKIGKKRTILPFSYDFEDFYGDEDYHNYMVTKLLKTHQGQCHSMPLLYLILAQEFKAEAYLSHSPSHSFIMFKDSYGRFANFETTSGYVCTRDMYLETNLIKAEAVRSGIYLRPLSLKETIASCLVDLGNYYQGHFGYDDFVLQCGIITKRYFKTSYTAQIMLENVGTAYLIDEARKVGFPSKENMNKYPKLMEVYTIMTDLQTDTDLMGYEEMPKEMYQRWLQTVEAEKNKRKSLSK